MEQERWLKRGTNGWGIAGQEAEDETILQKSRELPGARVIILLSDRAFVCLSGGLLGVLPFQSLPQPWYCTFAVSFSPSYILVCACSAFIRCAYHGRYIGYGRWGG